MEAIMLIGFVLSFAGFLYFGNKLAALNANQNLDDMVIDTLRIKLDALTKAFNQNEEKFLEECDRLSERVTALEKEQPAPVVETVAEPPVETVAATVAKSRKKKV